jgi:hypothetical protein
MADVGRRYQDGNYDLNDVYNSLSNDFACEKEFCDYIESHIQEFCEDCLGVSYKSHRREYPLSSGKRIKGTKRIDFLIVTDKNERIGVECKAPKNPSELSFGLGQCLTYLTMFEIMGKTLNRIVLLSTKIDHPVPFTIDKFNLPITFIAFDKQKFLTYQNGSSNRK